MNQAQINAINFAQNPKVQAVAQERAILKRENGKNRSKKRKIR